MGNRADKRQKRYDELKKKQTKAEDRRLDLEAMHRGMSGHPAHPAKRRGWHEMRDHELKARGMKRARTLFGGVKIVSMETHQDKMLERQERAKERKRRAKEAAKQAAKRAVKKKGFFSW